MLQLFYQEDVTFMSRISNGMFKEMAKSNNDICNLCLGLIYDNYIVVDDVNKEVLKILLININIADEIFMTCSSCLKKLQICYDFKCICLYVEDFITPWAESGVTVDIKEIFQRKIKSSEEVNLENYKICRLCLGLVENDFFKYINEEQDNSLQNELEFCLPELNLKLTSNPLVCEQCIANLKKYSSFLRACLENGGSVKRPELSDAGDSFKTHNGLDLPHTELEANFVCCETKIEELGIEINHTEDELKLYVLNTKSSKKEQDSGGVKKAKRVYTNCAYYCNKCTFATDYLSILKAHKLLRHRKPPIYMCDLCNAIFHTKKLFEGHLTDHRGPSKRFGCKTCSYETDHKSAYYQHLRHHKDPSEVKVYKCDLCPYTATLKILVSNHKKFNHSTNITYYKCSSCDFVTKHKNSLKSHVAQHEEPKVMFKCPHCDHKTRLMSNLRAHMSKHKERMISCDLCSFKGYHKTQVRRHMWVHMQPEDLKMHSCDLCSYSSKFKENLRRHKLVHLKPGERELFKCPHCDYEAKTKISITQHLLSHKNPAEIEKHSCPECPYETKFKNTLPRHMLKHRSKYELEKCFHCSLCLYVGKTRNSLQRHLLVHKKAGELKMYKCDKCPFESKHHNSLRYHDLTHKEVKKIFKCDQCGYETAHKANLTNHMITHKELGETPIYECAMCEFKTKYKHNLKSHSETCKKRRKRNK